MFDFASALYLGLRHPSTQTGRYDALTTGTPAALAVAPLANALTPRVARLQGCEAAMLAPSTLHLAIDTFDRLARTHALIADEALYPVMRWGLERAMGMGVPVAWFHHGDAFDVARRIRRRQRRKPPAIIADATCIEGTPTPVTAYLELARTQGGLIVLDQSQVLGLLGEHPSTTCPWGHGGGGVLPYMGIAPREPVLLLSSWAKAFGAPLATLGGPAELVNAVARDGPTQTHCSAASQSAMQAAMNALAINERAGERLRATLHQRLTRLEQGLRWLARTSLPDLHTLRRHHPLQQIRLGSGERTMALYTGLRLRGFRTALLHPAGNGYAVAVVVRADHGASAIDALVGAMAAVAPRLPPAAFTVLNAPTAIEEDEHVHDL
ncbi:Pyridoxal phosphate-dependent aminotransferase family protein [Pararobbsia alpina]|uniref:aminotransferase class I/II-fold pyridoxal phosphate-dependent enzyme n=1 Tax=Pararobbsia alpina TaxID=621374 RepID=UPI0039A66813